MGDRPQSENLLVVFKINMTVCVLFALGILGLLLYSGDFSKFAPSDLVVVAIYGSPLLLWVGGAWAFRKGEWSSFVWLLASFILMGIGLYGLYLDCEQTREEAITMQQTMHLGGFLAMLAQWAIGLPLLLILALIEGFTRRYA